MSDAPDARTAVLAIKIWAESSSPSGFIARLTSTRDLSSDEINRRVTSKRSEVESIVGGWLDEFWQSSEQP